MAAPYKLCYLVSYFLCVVALSMELNSGMVNGQGLTRDREIVKTSETKDNVSGTLNPQILQLFWALWNGSASKNHVSSPLSAIFGIDMLREGAGPDSTTQSELDTFLCRKDPNKRVEVDKCMGGLEKLLFNTKGQTGGTGEQSQIFLLEKLFVEKSLVDAGSCKITEQFLDKLQTKPIHMHQDVLEFENFKSDTVGATERINNWVEEKTNKQISHLLDTLGKDTLMVLVNVLYFKAPWAHPFKVMPGKQVFYGLKSQDDNPVEQKVTMMTSDLLASSFKTTFPCKDSSTQSLVVVTLPFKDRRFNLHIYMPEDRKYFNQFVEAYATELVDPARADEKRLKKNVGLVVPKFKIEAQMDLQKAAASLGMKVSMKPGADYSGMLKYNDLYDSGVSGASVHRFVQKAVMDFNENGLQAAAASGAVIQMDGPMPTVTVNCPFVAELRTAGGDILFIATVADIEDLEVN